MRRKHPCVHHFVSLWRESVNESSPMSRLVIPAMDIEDHSDSTPLIQRSTLKLDTLVRHDGEARVKTCCS